MWTSLSIKRFRGFRDFSLSPLDRVNLIAGSNAVGKTSLLEAIFLLLGETNASLVITIHNFRGLHQIEGEPSAIGEWIWSPLFHKFVTEATIEIEAQSRDSSRRRLRLKLVPSTSARMPLSGKRPRETKGIDSGFPSSALQSEYLDESGKSRTSLLVVDQLGIRVEPPPTQLATPGHFLAARWRVPPEEDARHYGQLEVTAQPYDILEVLKIVEPRLTRLSTIVGAGGAMLYGDIGVGRMVPLPLMGEGLGRFASLILRIATARGGFVLVDEIENGLHYAIVRKAWGAVAKAARLFEVQVFATTHSWECIRAAHEAFTASDTYDFRLHRLDGKNGEIDAVTYEQEALAAALKAELEVR